MTYLPLSVIGCVENRSSTIDRVGKLTICDEMEATKPLAWQVERTSESFCVCVKTDLLVADFFLLID